MFNQIAKHVVFPSLRVLELNYMRCRGRDLLLFLGNHLNLHTLTLSNLDITGNLSFKTILGSLEEHHCLLHTFRCDQIAQNSFRLVFETLGEFRFERKCNALPEYCEVTGGNYCFCEEFEEVLGPYKYCGVAEEWENVQIKIGLLKRDLGVSRVDYRPDQYPEVGVELLSWSLYYWA